MKKSKTIYLLPIFLTFTLIISYTMGEDSLGGAEHDFIFHKKFIFLFAEDLKNTFLIYGFDELRARNSPVLYIFLGYLVKLGIKIEYIRYLNFIVVVPLLVIFSNCIKIKYKGLNYKTLIILFSILLLSPTIRSLIIWPYPLIWATLFFLYSIFFYLKFLQSNNTKSKIYYALINIFFVALSSYLTPNFAFFSIYFFYNFFIYFKFSQKLILIATSNLVLALPAIYYYHLTDFYLLSRNYPYPGMNLNFSNKIILISTIIFFYFIPFLTFKNIKFVLNKITKDKKNIYLIIFGLINILFFNFDKNAGGGIFFHLSNLIFNNSIFVFLVFFIFLLFFNSLNLINTNNMLIFLILLLYNFQYTIYQKYFDPIIFLLFLFLIKFDSKTINLNYKKISIKFLILYSFFLFISIFKVYINY